MSGRPGFVCRAMVQHGGARAYARGGLALTKQGGSNSWMSSGSFRIQNRFIFSRIGRGSSYIRMHMTRGPRRDSIQTQAYMEAWMDTPWL